jgi:hypothetical protein
MSLPFSSPTWPKDADRAHYREVMRRGYPNASERQIDMLGAAGAMIDVGTKAFVSVNRAAVVDGEPVSPAVAAEVRQLGQPKRATLGVRWAA